MVARKENGIYLVSATTELNRYSFDGTADQVKAYIDKVVEVAKSNGMVGEGRFDFDLYRGQYADDLELQVTYYYDRTETDREKAVREVIEAKVKEEAAKKRKKAAEARKLKKDNEYAEFLRLKEKFEGNENA